MIRQDIAFFDFHKSGDLINRITSDVQDFKHSVKQCVSQVENQMGEYQKKKKRNIEKKKKKKKRKKKKKKKRKKKKSKKAKINNANISHILSQPNISWEDTFR